MKCEVDDQICYECQYDGFYEMFKGKNEDIGDMAACAAKECIFKETKENKANFFACGNCGVVVYRPKQK